MEGLGGDFADAVASRVLETPDDDMGARGGNGGGKEAELSEEEVYKSLVEAPRHLASIIDPTASDPASSTLTSAPPTPYYPFKSSVSVSSSSDSALSGEAMPPLVPSTYPLCCSTVAVSCPWRSAAVCVADTLGQDGADFDFDDSKFRVEGSLCVDGTFATFKIHMYSSSESPMETLVEFQTLDGDRSMVAKLFSNFKAKLASQKVPTRSAASSGEEVPCDDIIDRVRIGPSAPHHLPLGRDMSDATTSTDVSIADAGEDGESKLAQAQTDTGAALLEAEFYEEQAAGAALLAFASKTNAGKRAIAESPVMQTFVAILGAKESQPSLQYTVAFVLANACQVPEAATVLDGECSDLLCLLVTKSSQEGGQLVSAIRRESLRALVYLARDSRARAELRKSGAELAIKAATDKIQDPRLAVLVGTLSEVLV